MSSAEKRQTSKIEQSTLAFHTHQTVLYFGAVFSTFAKISAFKLLIEFVLHIYRVAYGKAFRFEPIKSISSKTAKNKLVREKELVDSNTYVLKRW
jgi:hypothetical protein